MPRVPPASPATTLVTIRVPVAMKERFDWMARVMNRPRNYVFVEALQRYLDQEESVTVPCKGRLVEARTMRV
jgi:predicted transcriptional regulator